MAQNKNGLAQQQSIIVVYFGRVQDIDNINNFMPELPEVETVRRGLSRRVVFKKIEKIIIKKPKLVKNSGNFFRARLIGNSFSKIERIGKLLIFVLRKTGKNKKKLYLLIHLKMTGQLIYCDKKNFIVGGHINSKVEEKEFFKGEAGKICQPGKYTHLIFEFADGGRLFFNDLRQFGYLKIVDEKKLKEVKNKFGIEPGRTNFTWENFQKTLAGRKANIKATLLNQSIISGLGNIYVDESLFASKIHPQRATNSITEKELKLLFRSIQRIIKLALKYKGTTFSDFIDSQGRSGNFKQKLKVYGRQDKNCLRCRKSKIKKIKVAGRGTHFCPVCQKKYQ